jgi:hypothetical protein
VVSVNEKASRISLWMKQQDKETSDLILISLEENSKFTLITVSGKIDFKSMAKLSGALREVPEPTEEIEEE